MKIYWVFCDGFCIPFNYAECSMSMGVSVSKLLLRADGATKLVCVKKQLALRARQAALVIAEKCLERTRTTILFVAARWFIFTGNETRFFGNAFQADDFDGLLIDAL